MNWLHFLFWVAGIYVAYYLMIILSDLATGKNSDTLKHATNELSFSESISPQEVAHLSENFQQTNADSPGQSGPQTKTDPEIVTSGGVLLKDVFSLARKEVIVYTRQVSF